jgi:hypothetical protein
MTTQFCPIHSKSIIISFLPPSLVIFYTVQGNFKALWSSVKKSQKSKNSTITGQKPKKQSPPISFYAMIKLFLHYSQYYFRFFATLFATSQSYSLLHSITDFWYLSATSTVSYNFTAFVHVFTNFHWIPNFHSLSTDFYKPPTDFYSLQNSAIPYTSSTKWTEFCKYYDE